MFDRQMPVYNNNFRKSKKGLTYVFSWQFKLHNIQKNNLYMANDIYANIFVFNMKYTKYVA